MNKQLLETAGPKNFSFAHPIVNYHNNKKITVHNLLLLNFVKINQYDKNFHEDFISTQEEC